MLRSDFPGFSMLKEVMVLQYGPVIWSRRIMNSEESFAVNSFWLDSLGLVCLNVGFSRYVGGQLLLL